MLNFKFPASKIDNRIKYDLIHTVGMERHLKSQDDFSKFVLSGSDNHVLSQVEIYTKNDLQSKGAVNHKPLIWDEYALALKQRRIAEQYLSYARLCLNTPCQRPPLLVISGRPGMGKDTLLHALAENLGLSVISSDGTHKPATGVQLGMLVFKETHQAFSFYREASNQAFVACVLEDTIIPCMIGYKWKREDTTAYKDHMIHIRLDSEDYDECTDQLIGAIASHRKIDLHPDETLRIASSLAKVSAEASPYNIAYLIDRALTRIQATQDSRRPFECVIELCEELALANPITNAPVDMKRPKITLDQLSFSAEVRLQIEKIVAISRKVGGSVPYKCLDKVSAQRSMRALFTGVPGTGKTAAAEAIAHELGKDLWVADFSKIKGMYVGESEKALKSLFKKSQAAQVVLLIDEADGLLCDRSTTQSESSRNLTNLALQLIWDYRGILILASNFKASLDPAMGRRLPHQIEFKAPGDHEAAGILETMLRPDAPLAEGIDFEAVVRGLGLTGGLLVSVIEEVFGLILVGEIEVITEGVLRKAAEKVAYHSHTGAKNGIKRAVGFGT